LLSDKCISYEDLNEIQCDDPHLVGTFDPNGISQHEAGAKLDGGKIKVGLMMGGFSNALMEVAKVATYGANKYSPNGWKSVPEAKERYTDAMYRHLLAEQQGEMFDEESELLHAAHAAWNALARLEFILEETE